MKIVEALSRKKLIISVRYRPPTITPIHIKYEMIELGIIVQIRLTTLSSARIIK
ncbi:hypothetical protein D3C85_1754100 [compost metagenome]